jgi:2-polyprenyl-3-methyl-5-hydroxy-6-metoxy-1,4-benzoquinol methylase
MVGEHLRNVEFVAHNIRLDDGTYTIPGHVDSMESNGWLRSTARLIDVVFHGDKSRLRLADLGCLEGGFAVEFARMGIGEVIGLDAREINIAACQYVKSRTKLPNLRFVQDDAWNIAKYGTFDIIFCCGLLYHLDRPKRYLELLSSVTSKLLIVQTHFSTIEPWETRMPRVVLRTLRKVRRQNPYWLGIAALNEGLPGRWRTEFTDQTHQQREAHRLSSWDNRHSFWIQREYLLQAIQDIGFDMVLEQFDSLAPNIVESMLRGFYRRDTRGTFIGIRSQHGP